MTAAIGFDDLANHLAPAFQAHHVAADRQREASPTVSTVAVVAFTIEDGDGSRVIEAGDHFIATEYDLGRAYRGRLRRVDAGAGA